MIYNLSKYNNYWYTKKLSELGTFSRGISKHRPRNDIKLFENGKYPLIQTGDVKFANLYITDYSQKYSEFGLKQSKLWHKGTLCITIAANIAETAILSSPMCFPDSIVGFNSYEDKSSELFMHYVITYIKNSIQNSVNGSIQDNINIEYLTDLDFKIPEKTYQDNIVNILSLLDKKIEMNNKINETLQKQASLLYDYWFTQFDFPDKNGKPYKSSGGKMVWNEKLKYEIPEGWKVQKLGLCIKHINTGLNPRDNFVLNNGNIKYITVKNLTTDGNIDFTTCDTLDKQAHAIVHKRSDVSKGDVLFASIAPLGRCFLIHENPIDWDINESVFSIRPDVEHITSEYLYMYLMSEAFVKKAAHSSTGSIFSGIRISTLQQMDILTPQNNTIAKFSSQIKTILNLKYKNSQEIQELTSLRDWLLPMLMNGQATVAEEQKPVLRVVENDTKNEQPDRFVLWLQNQGLAARGDIDRQTLREIFDAMDEDDK